MATPDLHEEQLTGEDEAVIMATDGLWDVISNQEAVDFIRDIKVGQCCQGSSKCCMPGHLGVHGAAACGWERSVRLQ